MSECSSGPPGGLHLPEVLHLCTRVPKLETEAAYAALIFTCLLNLVYARAQRSCSTFARSKAMHEFVTSDGLVSSQNMAFCHSCCIHKIKTNLILATDPAAFRFDFLVLLVSVFLRRTLVEVPTEDIDGSGLEVGFRWFGRYRLFSRLFPFLKVR